jgi:hypothetical protein
MITLSYTGTIKLIDRLSEDHDIKVQYWCHDLLENLKKRQAQGTQKSLIHPQQSSISTFDYDDSETMDINWIIDDDSNDLADNDDQDELNNVINECEVSVMRAAVEISQQLDITGDTKECDFSLLNDETVTPAPPAALYQAHVNDEADLDESSFDSNFKIL